MGLPRTKPGLASAASPWAASAAPQRLLSGSGLFVLSPPAGSLGDVVQSVGQNATDPAEASRTLPPAQPWPPLLACLSAY